MAIIDLQRNHIGIQSIINQFADYAAAGRGAMLSHSDGYVYCIFARNYLNGVCEERHLYMTRSNDAGVTWSAAIDLSTGTGSEAPTTYWDDDVAIIELGASDHTSSNGNLANDIGVVFNRGTNLTRCTFDKDTGVATNPYDNITSSPTAMLWPSIVRTAAGFLICCLYGASITVPYVYQYSNTSFTTNAWSSTTKTVFPTNGQPMSLSVKRLANGHLAMVGAYRTSLDGLAAIKGMGNLPGGILRCDVGAFFSSNDGSTWSAVQPLTSYGGTPALDLIGISSVASADLQELSDGRIVVGYQEHTVPQVISVDTALPFPSTSYGVGAVSHPLYHAGKNAIFCAACDTYLSGPTSDQGGVYIFDLTLQTRTRIYTGSSPAIWSDTVVSIDISADGNSLAIAMSGGGVCLLNITDPDPANWTTLKELRTLSTPSIVKDNVSLIRWDGNDTVYFSYGIQSAGGVWGARYDISTNLLTTLHTYSPSFSYVVNDFVMQSTKLIIVYSGGIEAVDKTTGLTLYRLATTDTSINNVVYDSVNNEYLGLSGNKMTRITDGGAFTEQHTFTSTSNPAWGGKYGVDALLEIPGRGIFVAQTRGYQWYSYASQKPAGYRVQYGYFGLGENSDMSTAFLRRGSNLKTNTWLSLPSVAHITLQNMSNVGRIRYAYCTYNAGTKVITPEDFYDVCNINKVGTNMTALQFPHFCADADDRLYWYFCRWDLLQPGGNEFAPVLGVTDPDSVKITMRARVRQTYIKTLTSRSRIQATVTETLGMRMRIVFAQCLKMKARIVPVQLTTLSLRARILNHKSTTCLMTFMVQSTRSTNVRLTFYVNTGYTGGSNLSLTMKARIVKSYSTRMTGHFLVRVPAATDKFSFSVLGRSNQTMSMRARIGMA